MKGAANVFFYRFQQFMGFRRGSGDILRWMTRFQLSLQRLQDSWNDCYVPITDVNGPEVRAYVMGLPQEEQQGIDAAQVLQTINERFLQTHAAQLPLSRT